LDTIGVFLYRTEKCGYTKVKNNQKIIDMNDAVDYALGQGQDLGVALWFIFLNLSWVIPTLLIAYFSIKLILKIICYFLDKIGIH